MRLKHIKLAGFKSFVDPTKVPFEQQMTAIVGPNGCGKSNIIDAVRWVLGESSAKNLRGDAMTDVIFNGAASRKPIGQASVELVFDNTSGRIQGSMADRNEVSIRRVVNRESTNSYYLNGSKCRRRDITDIFLGTGLGPRSYAIIEQGTISRLIESKPQELRVFIEEAAGISKYKERRKETETRIRHTRENLERLADIRSELSLRIDTLHQQAEAAKRFRTLKAKERKYRAELAVLRCQQYQEKQAYFEKMLTKVQAEIEDLVLKSTACENELFLTKQQVNNSGTDTSKLNQNKLELTTNIARVEQNIKHIKLQQNVLKQALSIADEKTKETTHQRDNEVSKLTEASQQRQALQPKLALCDEKLLTSYQILEKSNQEFSTWQSAWQTFHQQKNKQVALQTELEGQQKQQLNLVNNLSFQIEEKKQALVELTNAKVSVSDANTDTNINEQTLLLDKMREQIANCFADIETTQLSLHEQQHIKANLSGLQQAQQQIIVQLTELLSRNEDWQDNQQSWLANKNISIKSKILDNISVEAGWENSVEQVLGGYLEADVIDKFPKDSLPSVALLAKVKLANENSCVSEVGTLAEKVSGNHPFNTVLNEIFIAENYQEAQLKLATLEIHQSVICQDTTWLGHNVVSRGITQQNGELLKQRVAFDAATVKVTELEHSFNQAQTNTLALSEKLTALKTAHATLVKNENNQRTLVDKLKNNRALEQQQQQYQQQQTDDKKKEITKLEQLLSDEKSTLLIKSTLLADFLAKQNNVNEFTPIIDDEKGKQLQLVISQQQQLSQQLGSEKHKLAVEVERINNIAEHAKQMHERLQTQINALKIQQEEQKLQLEESAIPLDHDEQQLQSWLADLVELEKNILTINQRQSSSQHLIETLDQQKEKTQKSIACLKEQANKYHLEGESYKLRAQGVLDQLSEMQVSLNDILAQMPTEAKENIWQVHLVKIAKEIAQLGPINLAAIKEYEEQLNRKQYLDQQDNDLVEALTTLETAIVKIDKQSRHKFRITFDQVNQDLKSLFPKVFGGGNAYLELTGEDMLETGVTIMARPPGKKNSTIHLLSGGEKALTALSLVFAIFRLNPAPFCMLDEVDAPLDDANVERFCNLVREMSQTVQFIYISHNKIAMEMASHLTGITMFEAGVSRMVAVDIDEAMAMAELS